MRDDLPHAMRETARRLDPDVGRLTAEGVSRGTRLRRLERFGRVVGSAVAVAAVFGAAVFGAVVLLGAPDKSSPGTSNVSPTAPNAATSAP